MTKRIVLGADDYGQAEAVSRGIIDLILAGRLTATSSLTNGPDWSTHARWLLPCRGKAAFGLHLNLTQGTPLSTEFKAIYGDTFPGLGSLLLRAHARLLNQAAVQAELQAQLDAFKQAMGFYPAYLDGHQHIHHFPIVREALKGVYEAAQLSGLGVRIRSVHRPEALKHVLSDPKASLIEWTGAKRLLDDWLIPNQIPHNASFEGIYHFKAAAQCRAYFKQFFANIQDGGMIMCHPGRLSEDPSDPIASARHHEYAYLMSDDFRFDCDMAGVTLVCF